MKKVLSAILAAVMTLSLLPAALAAYSPGDLNHDGKVNAKDITTIQRFVAGGYGVELTDEEADLNRDGKVNAKDITTIQRFIAGGYGVELTPTEPVLSDEQTALIAYAEAMLARGARVQYSDTRLVPADEAKLYRWERQTLPAEAYTSQYPGYTNCAAFTHDVYYFALGFNITYWSTSMLIEASSDRRVFYYKVTGNETEEEKTARMEEFYAALEPCDIIVYRYSNKNSGHAMFYAGNDRIIHSTGSVYNYDTRTEKREVNGSIAEFDVHELFTPGAYRYLFENKSQFAIVRPLNIWNGTIPQETVNRVNNLQGVLAEKLCSKTVGQTVEPGEELTYTIHIENRNNKSVTLEVRDVVPNYTDFVSGCDSADGGSLSWTVSVPAGESLDVAYVVRVQTETPLNKAILADKATVGGVKCPCPTVYVGNHLSDEEKSAIAQAAAQAVSSDKRGWALVTEIYGDALGEDLSVVTSLQSLFAALFPKSTSSKTPNHFYLTTAKPYFNAVAPTIFGGRMVKLGDTLFSRVRTRGPYLCQVEVGDVAICTDNVGASPADSDYVLMMVAGEDAVLTLTGDGAPALLTGDDAQAALDTLISYQKFVVLRPAGLF